MKVFVVMANDFPFAVFRDDGEAQKFCRKKALEPNSMYGNDPARIRTYWRVYDFELQEYA